MGTNTRLSVGAIVVRYFYQPARRCGRRYAHNLMEHIVHSMLNLSLSTPRLGVGFVTISVPLRSDDDFVKNQRSIELLAIAFVMYHGFKVDAPQVRNRSQYLTVFQQSAFMVWLDIRIKFGDGQLPVSVQRELL